MIKQVTDKGTKYIMNWADIPKEDLYELFEGDVLEAIHFVVHNKLKLETRRGLDHPWVDEWGKGEDFTKMMKYLVSKGYQTSEKAQLDSWFLKFWRIKQPSTETFREQITW